MSLLTAGSCVGIPRILSMAAAKRTTVGLSMIEPPPWPTLPPPFTSGPGARGGQPSRLSGTAGILGKAVFARLQVRPEERRLGSSLGGLRTS